jgi:amphiphysin
MKHQIDLDVSEKAYNEADDHIKQTLPDLINAIFGLIPRLGQSMIVIQNNMLAHYYTSLHEYCQSYGYPIPSPEWKQVESEYDDVFVRVKQHTETISTLQQGRAVKQPFHSRPDNLQTRTVNHAANGNARRSDTNLGGAVGKLPPPVPTQRQQQHQSLAPPSVDFGSKPTRVTSASSFASRPSPPGSVASFHTAKDYAPSVTSAAASRVSSQITSPNLSRVTTSPQVRTAASVAGSQVSNSTFSSAAAAAAVASKKKPPPPPPKRKPSDIGAVYVIAQYDFDGEGEGDLRFREGDKIKIVKRTESENDWWEGECRGMRGTFPANYCKAA